MLTRTRPVSPQLVTVAILVLAAAVRLGWLVLTRHLVPINDPADYQRLAVSIASGHGFGRTVVAPGGGPTAFRPPLWPLFLAVIYWVVGVHVMVARSVEIILGTITVGLIGVLARQLWSRQAAWIAMLLAAVYPPFLLAGGSLLSESLSLPLELGSLAAALAARRSGRPWHWALLAGALAGLDVLARPDSIAFLVPMGLLLALGRTPQGWYRALAAFGVAALVVTPWLVRDAVVMGRFIPVTTQGGLVASGTYNDSAAHDHLFPAQWRPTDLVPSYRPLLRGNEVEEEAALRQASLRYISAHPLYPLRVSGWNLLRLFDLTGLKEVQRSWRANGYGPGVAATDAFGLAALGVLALLGAVARLVRDRRWWPWRWTWPIWLAPPLLVAVTVPVLGESRLRLGIDPFIVLVVSCGLLTVWELRRAGAPPPGPPRYEAEGGGMLALRCSRLDGS